MGKYEHQVVMHRILEMNRFSPVISPMALTTVTATIGILPIFLFNLI